MPSKVRNEDKGIDNDIATLVRHGAPPRRPGERSAGYVRRALQEGPFHRLRPRLRYRRGVHGAGQADASGHRAVGIMRSWLPARPDEGRPAVARDAEIDGLNAKIGGLTIVSSLLAASHLRPARKRG
jgi:hypothetical protein